MLKHQITILLLLYPFATLAQSDTTFYSSSGGKIGPNSTAKVAYYELNAGFDRNGLIKQYYPDHSLYGEVYYFNNRSNGTHKKYYKNGQIKEQRGLGEGENESLITRWYQNGQKRSENIYTYQEGERITRRTTSGGSFVDLLINSWDSLGNQQVKDGSGIFNATIFKNSNYLERGEYVDGKKVGLWTGIKVNKLDYEENYNRNGELVSGKSYDNGGAVFTYNTLETPAAYPDGEKKWARFLQKNLKYPKIARRNKIEGSVVLSFVVDQTGQILDIQVMSGIGSGCDEEAMRVLKLSKKWLPAIQRGRKVKSSMMLRLDFRMR
ncbi:hypothetical protein BFP71_12460 [Roseivirga misakiensis]|uniref:TonB C-terminal domain-containing protein n=2 Tax=Roseivirga misakiensis TaxID=1563681 RepID=A0A1E5SYT3_9BACT|nr:hypothetical protein BFP71_12460 [Roseivirga misakiensis]